MINVINNEECCGCGSCTQRCPKQCISFDEDVEGFRYPRIDLALCIDCHLCEKVCPMLNVPKKQSIQSVYAASSKDKETKQQSSSGGVFTYLATSILRNGGVVFGAQYDDDWEVYHDYCEDVDTLKYFRGSKYMQSRIGDCYKKAEQFLKEGRLVLFTGTPCQIVGLNTFLRKKYDNLVTVDFICHGVPSPKVWRRYLDHLINLGFIGSQKSDIKAVNFRAKIRNWISSQILISSELGSYLIDKDDDPYFIAFNMNVTLRPICYSCPFKGGKSDSNLTIADFWGIQGLDTGAYDERGTSMVIDYGKCWINLDGLNLTKESSECISNCNGSYYTPSIYNGNRTVFFGKLDKTKDIIGLMNRCTHPTKIQRVQNLMFRKIHNGL